MIIRNEVTDMCQVNMLEAKTELSKLVKKLETGEEDIVYIARNGNPVAKLTLVRKEPAKKRIGVAKGKLIVPDNFDSWDEEVTDMFGDV
jgi:antitoxin (DNA-binding transcriptional repressor) of toxin-antitoxin stability system